LFDLSLSLMEDVYLSESGPKILLMQVHCEGTAAGRILV